MVERDPVTGEERPLPNMNQQRSKTMWIVGLVLLAIVILLALYSFIGTAVR